LVFVCVLAGALFVFCAPVLAAGPEAPVVSQPDAVFATTARFHGVLNPGAIEPPAEAGSYQFVYRPSKAKECKGAGEARVPAAPGIPAGQPAEPVTEPVTGLAANTEYAVCLVAENGGGETASTPVAFKTAVAAPPEAPEATGVTGRRASEAQLNGVLNPLHEGEPGSYRFLYKQSASECEGGTETPETPAAGGSPEAVSVLLPAGELLAHTTYTFCLKALNALGEATVSAPQTFTTALPPETPEEQAAQPVGGSTATLRGVLNPQAAGEKGAYEFRYRKSASECQGAGELASASSASLGAEKEEVSAPVSELLPATSYTFCLLAVNAAEPGEEALGPPETFTTLPVGASVEETFATDVTSTSVTLHAKLNPGGADTTYSFEDAVGGSEFALVRGPSGETLAGASGDAGSGIVGVPVEVKVQGLSPASSYRFRLVASSTVEPVDGPSVSFTTQTAGAFALPDARKWEMVSPPQKLGALIEPIGEERVIQTAVNGDAITYTADAPTEPEPEGYANEVQALSARATHGWRTQDIAIPHTGATGASIGVGEDYRLFSTDLSRAVVQPAGAFVPSLSPEASEQTAYLRTNYPNADINEPCVSSCYHPLVTRSNDTANPFQPFGEEGACPEIVPLCGPQFVGANPSLTHVELLSGGLTSTTAGVEALYEWAGGKLTPVSLLPESQGAGPASSPELGFKNEGERHAVSDDGSRVFWTSAGHLYMRDLVREETVEVDGGKEGSIFQDASSDGSRVLFIEKASGGLYECEILADPGTGKLGCSPSQVATNLLGLVAGVSEDGSWVYFISNSVLAPGAEPGTCEESRKAPPGLTCNLYVRHGGVTRLVAVLSGNDASDWAIEHRLQQLQKLTARVSPDGRWFAFMSQRELTGYDNRDAVSGQRDEEVYLYDGESGRLVCASCNPSGARPVGGEYGSSESGNHRVYGGDRVWAETTWLAANVPGLTPYRNSRALYQSRYLSDSGRLFFNSSDGLVPKDVNGTWDVYEYEPQGVGVEGASCGSGVVGGSVVFRASRAFEVDGRGGEEGAGCVGLISSGQSGNQSAFIDASETGSDVFFLTTAKLAATQDFDDSYDVYDAHECTGVSPCLPAPAEQPPACVTTESCRTAPAPAPGVFGSPSSATFSGTGNLIPVAPAVKAKVKPLTRAQKLAAALKVCRKKPKGKRASCERQARHRYGPTKKAPKKARKGGH
jgi:WD40-like Beta Propeller Repeat